MSWRRIALLLPMSCGMAGGAIGADVGQFTLMGIGLGMTPAEVEAALSSQSRQVQVDPEGCAAGQDCVNRITATMPDGTLEIWFAAPGGREQVDQVVLTVKARGLQDRELVRQDALSVYGHPTFKQPAWCWPDAKGSGCRADGPSLVFKTENGVAGVLVLSGPRD